jgi:hypothetical protein
MIDDDGFSFYEYDLTPCEIEYREYMRHSVKVTLVPQRVLNDKLIDWSDDSIRNGLTDALEKKLGIPRCYANRDYRRLKDSIDTSIYAHFFIVTLPNPETLERLKKILEEPLWIESLKADVKIQLEHERKSVRIDFNALSLVRKTLPDGMTVNIPDPESDSSDDDDKKIHIEHKLIDSWAIDQFISELTTILGLVHLDKEAGREAFDNFQEEMHGAHTLYGWDTCLLDIMLENEEDFKTIFDEIDYQLYIRDHKNAMGNRCEITKSTLKHLISASWDNRHDAILRIRNDLRIPVRSCFIGMSMSGPVEFYM